MCCNMELFEPVSELRVWFSVSKASSSFPNDRQFVCHLTMTSPNQMREVFLFTVSVV